MGRADSAEVHLHQLGVEAHGSWVSSVILDTRCHIRPWLEASDERLKEMERNLDLCFSSGRFSCLPKPVALMELNKVFVEVGSACALRLF